MPGADQLALAAGEAAAVVVPDFHGHAQRLALQFAAHTGSTGLPMAKQETMSVPPEIDDRQRSLFSSR